MGLCTGYSSFHFLVHYPNTTPIYFSSFHFLCQYPEELSSSFRVPGASGRLDPQGESKPARGLKMRWRIPFHGNVIGLQGFHGVGIHCMYVCAYAYIHTHIYIYIYLLIFVQKWQRLVFSYSAVCSCFWVLGFGQALRWRYTPQTPTSAATPKLSKTLGAQADVLRVHP